MLVLEIGLPVLAAIILIAFAVWAHQYTKVGPNEVLVISGRKKGYRIVRGGGTYVRPFREKVQRLSLELMQFDVRSAETYTMHGVPVQVDGVCMVKVNPSDHGIEQAATQFLSRAREDIVRTAMQAVGGHLRGAIGALSIEDIYRERQRLVAAGRPPPRPPPPSNGPPNGSPTNTNLAHQPGGGRGGPLVRAPARDHAPGGARPGAPGGDHRAPEGNRADAGRGGAAQARARGRDRGARPRARPRDHRRGGGGPRAARRPRRG